MKPIPFLRILTGAACAVLATPIYAESTSPPPAGSGSASSATSVFAEVAEGKGKIIITIEKDGKKETRTLDLNSDDPKAVEKLLEEIGARGGTAPPSAKKTVPYLGVMFAEAPEGDGSGGFRWYGLSGGGGGGGIGGGSGAGGGGLANGGKPAVKGLPPGTGLTISGVSGGSPAEKAGLQAGDVLARLDEQILVNPGQFTTLIRNKKEGDTIKLALMRSGEAKDLAVTLATREEEQPGTFGYGFGGQGGVGKLFRPGKGLPGGGATYEDGRVLRLEKDGKIIEEWLDGEARPRLTPPQPSGALSPEWPDKLKKLHESLPAWEKTLRDAADVKDKAADQWKKQLADWRDQWTKTQEKTAAEFRRAMEKMGEEIRKASEAALKAQEDARRAIEAEKEKRTDDKAPPPAEENKDPEQLKKA